MRTTQYIGLNDYAEAYLREHATLLQDEAPTIGIGMFEEPITGRVWKEVIREEQPDRYLLYEEVVQDSPWSSGPMIFTHLKVTLKQGSLAGVPLADIDSGFYFSWMVDPSLKGQEYDPKTGRYWV